MNRVPSFLRWLAGGLIGVAVVTGLLVLKGQGQKAPLPASITATASPTSTAVPALQLQRLLVTVTDKSGHTLTATIINRRSNSTAVDFVNIDSRTVVDLDTLGMASLDSSTSETSANLVQDSITAATGFPIDGTLVLQRLSLAGLIDGVGGIDIVSDGDYVVSPDGVTPVYVYKGQQHLDGTQASYYATFLQFGQTESSRSQHLSQVLSAAFAKLPHTDNRLGEVITALGALARSTVPSDQVAQMMLHINATQGFAAVNTVRVPTVKSDLGSDPTLGWRRVNRKASLALAQALTGETSSSTGAGAPIVVMVTGGTPAQRLAQRDKLVAAQLPFADGGPAKARPVTIFQVSTRLTKEQIAHVAQALALPAAVAAAPQITANLQADAVVTLGTDVFTPNP